MILPSKKVYTPMQVFAGTLFGGPIAAVIFIRNNFQVIGEVKNTQRTIYIGVLFVLTFIVGLPYIPEYVPNIVIQNSYPAVCFFITNSFQFTRNEVLISTEFSPYSIWHVSWVSFISLIAIAALFVGINWFVLPYEAP